MAAIDIDICADDETGPFRGQKNHGIGDVFRRAPASERHFGAPSRLLLLEAAAEKDFVVQRQPIGERAFDPARTDRVDENIVAATSSESDFTKACCAALVMVDAIALA